jgi:hypothetical protein
MAEARWGEIIPHSRSRSLFRIRLIQRVWVDA